MPGINPALLRWARETAALSLDEAAKKIQLGPARGVPAAERLAAIEAGDAEPSTSQLHRMAKQYRRPLISFYLEQIPAPTNIGTDFRSQRHDPSERDEALLGALLRDIHARQQMLRAALLDDDETPLRAFVGSCRVEAGAGAMLQALIELLGMSRAVDRAAVERSGALVMLQGGESGSGGRDSNPRPPAWKAGALPLSYPRVVYSVAAAGPEAPRRHAASSMARPTGTRAAR